jgi:hypothetical protein
MPPAPPPTLVSNTPAADEAGGASPASTRGPSTSGARAAGSTRDGSVGPVINSTSQHQAPAQQQQQQPPAATRPGVAPQQQSQQPPPAAAATVAAQLPGTLKRGGRSGAGAGGDGSSVDNSVSNSYANTPRGCFPVTPVTPPTPYTTPDDSAIAMGGRSPRGASAAGAAAAAAATAVGVANGTAAAAAAAAAAGLRWPSISGGGRRSAGANAEGSGAGGLSGPAVNGAAGPRDSEAGGAAEAGETARGAGVLGWAGAPPRLDEGRDSEPGTPLHVYGHPVVTASGLGGAAATARAGHAAAAIAALGGRGSYDGSRPDSPLPNRGPLQRGSDGGLGAARVLARCSSDGCVGGGRGAGAGGGHQRESSEDGASLPIGRCPTVGEFIRLRGASDSGAAASAAAAAAVAASVSSGSGRTSGGSGTDEGQRNWQAGVAASLELAASSTDQLQQPQQQPQLFGLHQAAGAYGVDLCPGPSLQESELSDGICRQGSMGWEGWHQEVDGAAVRGPPPRHLLQSQDGNDASPVGAPTAPAQPQTAPGAAPPAPPPPAAGARGGRARVSSSMGGATEVDPSPLGDPGRAAHFMDEPWLQQQAGLEQAQQQPTAGGGASAGAQRPPALSRLNIASSAGSVGLQQPGSSASSVAWPANAPWRGLGLLGEGGGSASSLSGGAGPGPRGEARGTDRKQAGGQGVRHVKLYTSAPFGGSVMHECRAHVPPAVALAAAPAASSPSLPVAPPAQFAPVPQATARALRCLRPPPGWGALRLQRRSRNRPAPRATPAMPAPTPGAAKARAVGARAAAAAGGSAAALPALQPVGVPVTPHGCLGMKSPRTTAAAATRPAARATTPALTLPTRRSRQTRAPTAGTATARRAAPAAAWRRARAASAGQACAESRPSTVASRSAAAAARVRPAT